MAWNRPANPETNDPILWIKNKLGEETWSKQEEICISVRDNRYTAVKSCHGPGKSHIASRLIGWWFDTKVDPFVVTSAPTGHQVRSVLWRYIQRVKNKANLPGKITGGQVPEWKIGGELMGFGRKPADYLDPQEAAAAFQGIHATNVLIILDEGSGIPEWLATACETLNTNETSRFLIIGNPDNPQSWFAKCFRSGSDYNKITIKASDTPNFTGEPVSDRLKETLTSKIWVEERKKRWGEHSPLYISKVEAEFPDVADDMLFTPALIEKAHLIDRSRQATAPMDRSRNGLDIARYGPDESVLYRNRGGYVRIEHRWAKMDTMQSVGEFRRATKDTPENVATTVVDVNGVGAGVFDRLKELGYSVVPFNGGERAYNNLRYRNRRAEAYIEAAELMDQGLIDLDPEDQDLVAELMEIKTKESSTGQKTIEDKDEIKKRLPLTRSPDRADAFVMSLQKHADLMSIARHRFAQPKTEEVLKPQRGEPQDYVGDLYDMEF